MFGRICLWIHLVQKFFVGCVFITYSISFLVVGLFKFSISSWFSFGRLYVSRKLSISSRSSNLLAYNCSYYSHTIYLYFCIIHWDFSFFISYIIYLSSFSPFLVRSGKRFFIFSYLIKEPVIDFFLLFFWISIGFLSDLYDFLPFADLEFCLLFP